MVFELQFNKLFNLENHPLNDNHQWFYLALGTNAHSN